MKLNLNNLFLVASFALVNIGKQPVLPVCAMVRDGECPVKTVIIKTETPKSMSAKSIWAHIVSGESGGAWPEGSLLVAWTLRSWQVYRGMPPENAGKRWGWHAWREPTLEAIQAVNSVWDQPMSNSPFEFMRNGNYCIALGSNSDSRYWKSIGWYDQPDFDIQFSGTDYGMNCYWRPAGER